MDKITELNQHLRRVKETFDIWQKSGLNEEVLVIYLHHKTKVSIKEIRKVLNEQKYFFDKLIKKEVVKRLEEGNEN